MRDMFYKHFQSRLREKQSRSRNIAADLIFLEGKHHVRVELNAQPYADIVSPSGSFRLPLLGYPVWQCGCVIIQEFRTHRSALLMAAPAYTRRVHGGMHRLLVARARDSLRLFTHGHRKLSSGAACRRVREKIWRIISHNIAGILANPRILEAASCMLQSIADPIIPKTIHEATLCGFARGHAQHRDSRCQKMDQNQKASTERSCKR